MRTGRGWVRVLAFVRKELVGVLRQPVLVLALVLGPFLILLMFGAGLSDRAPDVRTVVVAPEGSVVAEQAREFAETQATRLIIEEVTADLDGALRRLRRGGMDLVVEFPADADAVLAAEQQPTIVFYHDYLDPIEADAMVVAMRRAVDDLNAAVARARVARAQQEAGQVQQRLSGASERVAALRAAIASGDVEEVALQLARLRGEVAGLDAELDPGGSGEEAAAAGTAEDVVGELADRVDDLASESDAPGAATAPLAALAAELDDLRAGLAEFGALPPGLFVSPYQGVAETVIEGPVQLTDYYAPAVLVLLAQHLAVTFLGLSVVRDAQLGTTDLLRVAPVTPGQVLAGKSLAYLLLTGAVSAVLTALLIAGLGVPMRGDWALLALTVLVVLTASIGLGFLLALAASSATQAVSYAMMLLLANVFFSGFLLSVERFLAPVRAVPWLLPATYGVALLRQVMLTGEPPSGRLLGVLVAASVVLLGLSWALLGRRLRRG